MDWASGQRRAIDCFAESRVFAVKQSEGNRKAVAERMGLCLTSQGLPVAIWSEKVNGSEMPIAVLNWKARLSK